MPKETICVLGLGYIGLPTASILATNGFKVVGVDVRKDIVDNLAQGKTIFEEPGLKTLVEAAVKSGELTVSAAACPADVFFICVPTPFEEKSKKADLRYVKQAAVDIARVVKKGDLVILESTVPAGTTENLLGPILAKSGWRVPGEVLVAHCPERVLPGRMLNELVTNDRIVGGMDQASAERARYIYKQFVSGQIHLTDAKTAEFVKLAENTFRDVNIAFANEMEAICQKIGINPWEAIRLANKHPRVQILNPGPGVGGHCIAVDPWFIVESAPELARVTRLAREINDEKPLKVIAQIEGALAKTKSKKPRLVFLGATYKANVDDIRESPALKIIQHFLKKSDIGVWVVEPYGWNLDHSIPVVDMAEGLDKSDVIVILVDHREFLEVDWESLVAKKGAAQVLDFKGVLNH